MISNLIFLLLVSLLPKETRKITYVDCFEFEETPTINAFNRFPDATPQDMESLYRIAWAEAGINGEMGMKFVVWNIEKRMEHPSWKGMSILSIVKQRNQFHGYKSKYYRGTIPEEAYRAVRKAMEEPNPLPYGYVYYWNPKKSTSSWFRYRVAYPQQHKKIMIGDHEFFPDPNLKI